MKEGKLLNLLDRTVLELAAGAISMLLGQKGSRPVRRMVSHAGGVDVLFALAGAMPGHSLAASATVLRSNGNLSSPSVLFALEETLRTAAPDMDGDFWLVSFGAEFSAHSCCLGVGES
jgi:predicted naringenin-chalcone synthase